MRIIVQFMGQAVGVILLRRRIGAGRLPFRMWLYPVPALVAFFAWSAIFLSTGPRFMAAGTGVILLGVVVFLIRAHRLCEWPFNRTDVRTPGGS
jgi:amino acid transporter